jgi:uncharacterized membrane protein YjfL (UPF0719 family)
LTDRSGPPTQGTIGPTRLSALAAVFVCGGLLGYALVPISEQLSGTAPRVEWAAVGALTLIAGVLLVFAYTTYRTVHRDRRLIDARRAVNFLMLAKASARVGALVAGGYLGFALQFVDSLDVPLPRERFVRSLICAVTGVVIVVSALLLERACRVPKDEDD